MTKYMIKPAQANKSAKVEAKLQFQGAVEQL